MRERTQPEIAQLIRVLRRTSDLDIARAHLHGDASYRMGSGHAFAQAAEEVRNFFGIQMNLEDNEEYDYQEIPF